MKRKFILFAPALFCLVLLMTSCNLKSDDTPVTGETLGVVKQSLYGGDYLSLPDGKTALCKGLPSSLYEGDLVYAYYTLESEHSDTNAYKYTLNIQQAAKVNTYTIKQIGLDTLGKSPVKAISPYCLEKYLVVWFNAAASEGDKFFLVADSLRLQGKRLVDNDTMFLELRRRSNIDYGSLNFTSAICADLSRESFEITKDSLVIAIKFRESDNRFKTQYAVGRRKFFR